MSRRLFYAIEFPDQVRSRLAEISRSFAGIAKQGRWTDPDNLHLTLQFLGECPDEWLDILESVLRRAVAGYMPFKIKLSGCGTFGRQQDVLWIGVESHPNLNDLAGSLTRQLENMKLPHEARAFAPHITIGRRVRIEPELLRRWAMTPIDCPVGSISLMESTRILDRLAYIPLLHVPLSSANI